MVLRDLCMARSLHSCILVLLRYTKLFTNKCPDPNSLCYRKLLALDAAEGRPTRLACMGRQHSIFETHTRYSLGA